jgi:signal transduction histidine kinase
VPVVTRLSDRGSDREQPLADATPVDDGARTVATADLVIELVTAASGEFDVERILQTALQRLAGLVRFTGGSVALADGDDLVIRAAVGPFADEAMGQRLRRGPSRSWNVVQTGEPFMSGDLHAAGLAVRTATGRDAIRSWLGVPLVRSGQGIGLLEVDSTEQDAFDEDTVRLMTIVARVLSGPIDLAWRHEEDRRSAALREAFIGVISHELRTPITTIYGTSRLLRARATRMPSGQRAELLADVEAEADRLYRLVEDLLVLSRAERGRVEIAREPILLGHVVQRVVQAEQARWPDRAFRLAPPGALPAVSGEETYAEQIVRNLLSNAAKYSPSGSTIEVAVEADADDVLVRVLDEGVGIGPDDAARLFELFYRGENAARQAPGAGIGLFVVSELVRAMGGRAWARARDGGGSEFGVAMPIAALDEA